MPPVWSVIAGLSGTLGLVAGSYGAHGLDKKTPEQLKTWDSAVKMHMLHGAIMLLMLPLTHRPNVTGVLFTTGVFLFSTSCYISVLTNDKKILSVTPLGGLALMAGWLSIAF